MSTLLLDIGNTRCKWGLWADGTLTGEGAIDNDDIGKANVWTFALDADQAFACSVASAQRTKTLQDVLEPLGVELTLAQTTAEHAGVRCAYTDPSRLGVDRWMAVLAGSRLPRRPALIVDAGTALTIDAVDNDGNHAGGFIIPGIQMMQSALTTRTANIRIDEPEAINESFGTSTSEAVRNGALVAAAGAVDRAANWLAMLCDTDPDALAFAFTGGNGELLADTLNRAADFHANFVLDGLAIYAGLAP
ncbi:MAG: type III pantothenate kinase [Pseudomonadota bacterium]